MPHRYAQDGGRRFLPPRQTDKLTRRLQEDAMIITDDGKRLRLKNATLEQLKELLED